MRPSTRRGALLGAALAAAAALPGPARADRRYYAETYNAVTAAPGGLDVELWSTLHQAPRQGGTSLWRHQLELETGLTERWDLALYNVLRSDRGGSTRYEAVQLESRYRLSQPGEWAVDPVLYLELKKEFLDDKPLAVEGKLILARDFRAWNLSLNLGTEQEFLAGGGHEAEYGFAAGASYEFAPALRLGAEVFGDATRPDGQPWEHHLWAGPVVSVAWSRFWLAVGSAFGLNDQSERTRLRAILAIQL
jgi:hypothetical protein